MPLLCLCENLHEPAPRRSLEAGVTSRDPPPSRSGRAPGRVLTWAFRSCPCGVIAVPYGAGMTTPETGPTTAAPGPRAVAVVLRDRRLLVIKRHFAGRDYAVLPGGSVEPGESFEEAVVRELQEEATMAGRVDRLLLTD